MSVKKVEQIPVYVDGKLFCMAVLEEKTWLDAYSLIFFYWLKEKIRWILR